MKNIRILIYLPLIALGLIAGFLFSQIERSGAFIKWEKLPPAPITGLKLITIDKLKLYASTREGSIISWTGEEWVKSDLPKSEQTYPVKITSCDSNGVENWPTTNPPREEVSCIESKWVYIESSYMLAYAIDKSGGVWRWYSSNYAYTELTNCVTYPCLGATITLVIGYLVLISIQRIKRKKLLPIK